MSRPYGKLLISFIAAVAVVTPYLADWNESHIYNDTWAAHAKFHVGHTILLGTVLGLLALWYLWRRSGAGGDNLRTGALVAGSYWLAQLGAALVPGTAAVDPAFADRIPTIAGVQIDQLFVDALLLVVVAAGYRWQRGSEQRGSRASVVAAAR